MNRTILTIISLIVAFLLHFFSQPAYCQTVLKGKISTVIKQGEVLKINLKTPINFYFSVPGDKVTALIPNEIKIGRSFYIPKGSKIEGVITEIKNPKRFGQAGAFEINFTEITTPENILIPIYASTSTDTSSASKKITRTLAYDSALITYGTLHGAIAGAQYGGIPLAISSHGISILAGAGIGTTFGIIGSVLRKGEIPITSILRPQEVLLKSNLYIFGDLPEIPQNITTTEEESKSDKKYLGFRFLPPVKKNDIKVEIKKLEKKHNNTLGEYLIIGFTLSNSSNKNINLSDLVLINKSNNEEVIYADVILSGIKLLKSVKPAETISSSLAFSTSKKGNYDLAIIDPLDNKEIVRIPLKEKGDL